MKNVFSEYKRHGISPERLKEEAQNLSGGEKLKALDIADVYDYYQRTVLGNNFRETGDIYSSLNDKDKNLFNEAFNFIYPDVQFVLVNGFDEFTLPEVEIINSASEMVGKELYVVFDYYKYNAAVFSHLNKCHDQLEAKGFKEVKDISPPRSTILRHQAALRIDGWIQVIRQRGHYDRRRQLTSCETRPTHPAAERCMPTGESRRARART